MEQFLGIKVGETTKDGKYTLKNTSWLGWCVNDPPGIMLKKKGTEYIIPIVGALRMNPAFIL